MDQAKAIHTEAGYICVLYKVLTLELEFVVFVPVAADGQNFGRRTVDGDHIRQCNLILIFVAGQIVVNAHLQHLVAVVLAQTEALVLRFALLNIREERLRLTQVGITVEARYL